MPVIEDKYETLFVRVLPEVKEALQSQVDGMNATRPLGAPAATLSSFVLGCINQSMGWEHTGPLAPTKKPKRKAGKK